MIPCKKYPLPIVELCGLVTKLAIFLLVGDEMLWFGTQLENSLINPNQIRSFGWEVADNPFVQEHFGINCPEKELFIPFDTTGTIVYFELRVPNEWEKLHLPVLPLFPDRWDPQEDMIPSRGLTREQKEMKTIRSLTSGLSQRSIMAIRNSEANSKIVRIGEVETVLGSISPTFNDRTFCDRLIAAVNIATSHRDDTTRTAAGIITNERHSKVSVEDLAEKWNIGLETAKRTLQVTTQRGIRTALHPLTRRVRVDHLDLHRTRLRGGTWYCDTMFAKVKSKIGNTCANVFTNGKFTTVIPMTSKADSGKSLIDFTDDVGIPEDLVTDLAGEFTGKNTEFIKEARRMRIRLHNTESGRHNQNAAEREIMNLGKRWRYPDDEEASTKTFMGLWISL